MLQGLRIVEFEGLGPGPFAAMMLAELGAEVIVIHRPQPPDLPGTALGALDRGKRSIQLDLKAPADLALARDLALSADGLIEGLRPGVMERLGLGPEALGAANPRLVYGRMTGWGQAGPLAPRAGHDLIYAARAGALWGAGLPGAAPMPPLTTVGDIGGGALYLVAGMLAGLLAAARSGRGQVVDAAIVDGAAHALSLALALMPARPERGQSLLDGPHWSRCYPTADGGWLAVQALEPPFYAQMLAGFGLDHDPAMQDQHDPAQWPAQSAILAAVIAQKSRAEWDRIFGATDACVAPVWSPREAAADPHLAARGIWHEVDGHMQPAPAPRFAPLAARGAGAARPCATRRERGADGADIRAELAAKAESHRIRSLLGAQIGG